MSGEWWWTVEAPPAPGILSRLLPVVGEAPPAALLRIPPIFSGIPTSIPLSGEIPEAISADWRGEGFAIGTATSQLGYVLRWTPRSVDLRGLLLRFFRPWPGDDPDQEETFPTDREEGSSTGLRRPNRDDLALRLVGILEPPPEALLRAHGPLEWPQSFYPYQREGIHALTHSSHLLLGDEMGLGKTIQAIAAIRLLLHAHQIERALVVTPASLLDQWKREIARWAPELRVILINGSPDQRLWQWQYRAHVTLVSYDTLRADFSSSPSSGPRRKPWSVVVLDEAQRIKNRHTDVSRACKRLPRQRSWALTGTPLENSTDDVVSILEFVAGGTDPAPVSPKDGPALRSSLDEYLLRRRKAEVLQDLPPKIFTDLLLPLTPSQRRAYDRAEREGLIALRSGQEITIESVLALIHKLKQICNFAPGGGASTKMDDLLSRMEELSATGQKALVFTQYTGEESGARRIAHALEAFGALVYTGEMSLAQRSQVIQRFQEEEQHRVLVLSLQAGGQGLNLQSASYVFHFDRAWNPAVEQQAEDRSHRMGQSQSVHVYRYLMEDTVEQRIDAVLRGKVGLFEEIIEGAAFNLGRLLGKEELLSVVGGL